MQYTYMLQNTLFNCLGFLMYLTAGSLLVKEHNHVIYDVLTDVGARGLAAGALMIVNSVFLLLSTVYEVRAKMKGADSELS